MRNEPEKGDKDGDGKITLDELTERLGGWRAKLKRNFQRIKQILGPKFLQRWWSRRFRRRARRFWGPGRIWPP